MIVRLSTDGAVVRDADDCGRLHVETDLTGDDLAAALRATGTGTGEPAEGGDVWLDVATLRSRAQLAAQVDDWAERWDAMVAYAGSKGWLSPDGRSLRTHIG